MKTNQLMQVRIGNHVLPIEHKSMFGSLTDLWNIGNSYRIDKGLSPLDLGHWRRSQEVLEYLKVVEKDVLPEYAATADYTIEGGRLTESIASPLIKTKRGKGGGTWVHLYLLLDAAARLDPEFKHLMYKTFVENKILQWRDDSGDEFINLNVAIDAYLLGRGGKDNLGVFITCAKLLKTKIAPDGDNWNTASSVQLENRANLEKRLVDLLRLGVVRDWEHLKELIEKL